MSQITLKESYKQWRKDSEQMLADGFTGSLDCGEYAVREDFSKYTGLSKVINFEDMLQLEKEYEE